MYYVFSKLLVPDAYVWEWGRLTICSMYQHALIITVYERLCNTGQNGQSDHRLFHMMPKEPPGGLLVICKEHLSADAPSSFRMGC